jgi:S1-C subfamily serine protease
VRWLAPICLAALVGGCGPKVSTGGAAAPDRPDPIDEPDEPAADASGTPATPDAADAPADASVHRRDLVAVLDAGPGAFLAGIDMKPHFREQRFSGWEIVQFWPDDPRYAAVDIRPGDVVSEVNGKPIMRPEQLFEIWTELRSADAIVVVGQRGGERFELSYEIVDPPAPAPAPPAPQK